jgi:hypothetical protein
MVRLITCLISSLFLPAVVLATTETIIDDQDLFQTVFPANSDIREQQIPLDENVRERIDKRFHIKPAIETVTVWLASDPTDGRILGGMIKVDGTYQKHPLSVAVVMSVEQRINRVAIADIDPQIRESFASTIGIGYIKRYTMVSARQLSYMRRVLTKQGEPSAWLADQVFKNGAILSVILEDRTGMH